MKRKLLTAVCMLIILLLNGCNYYVIKENNGSLITKIELPYVSITVPAIVNSDLYIAVGDKETDEDICNKLIQYDTKSKKEKLLFESKYEPASIQGIKANEKWLLWSDGDVWGAKEDLYAKNINTGEQKIIYSRVETKPSVSVSPFLWKDDAILILSDISGKGKIIQINLDSGQTKEIAEINNIKYFDTAPYIKDGKLLYSISDGQKSYYKIYDIETSDIITYEIPEKYVDNVQMADDKIYSISFGHGKEYPTINKLCIYDTNTHQYIILDEDVEDMQVFNNGIIYKTDKAWMIYKDHKQLKQISLDLGFNPSSFDVVGNGRYLVAEEEYFDEGKSILYMIDTELLEE